MGRNAIDLALLVVVAIGGMWAWQTGHERSRLEDEHERLAQTTGDLPVADPSRLHVRALETGEPLHFAWRMYLPPRYRLALVDSAGGRRSTGFTDAKDLIARVRFREDPGGRLEVYTRFGGVSTRGTLGNRELADLLRGRWHEVRVEQLGADRIRALGPAEPAVFLRLTLPDELRDQARKVLPSGVQARLVPVLYELDLGRKPATR